MSTALEITALETGSGEIKLGLRIHGEPGVQTISFEGVGQVMSRVLPEFAKRLQSGRYVVLLNNLGSTTRLEMSIVTEELRKSSIGAKLSHIIGPAAMMAALDMHGFSLTLYPLGAEDAELLSADTKVPAWPGMQTCSAALGIPLPVGHEKYALALSATRIRSDRGHVSSTERQLWGTKNRHPAS